MDSFDPSEKTPLLKSESEPANSRLGTGDFLKCVKEVVKDTSEKYKTCYDEAPPPRTASITICIHGNDDSACADCVSDDESDQDSESSHCHGDSRRKTVDKKARKKLIVASLLCLSFMVGEIVGGSIAGSLAIMTDAAHLLTDFASFMISLFALWVASRPATKQMHFGWYRAEVVGALVSVLMIWVITGVLVYLAVERIISNDYEIDAKVMLITAGVGVGVNIVMGSVLHTHSHEHSHGGGGGETVAVSFSMQKSSRIEETRRDPNINVRAAFIHVVGDFVQSLGVLVAALVIYFKPGYKLADPICTFLFSVLVLITTLAILRDTINVLMEGAPKGINFNDVKKTLFGVPGVIEVHNLRIWALTMDKVALAAHLAIDPLADPREVLKDAQRQLKANYNVFESTVQVEDYSRDMQNCTQCKDPED